jgi:ATP-binding protein involved in chromosome partitioning
MSVVTQQKILETLSSINDEKGAGDIVSAGMISGIQVGADGHVLFMIEVDPARGAAMEPLRQRAENAIAALPGVKKVSAILTAERAEKSSAPDPHGMNKNPPLDLPIKNIIAVASGKGGVGKSTVAFNLAVALARSGKTVGLLDADIYGPSVPRLSGIGERKPEQVNDKIIPLEAHGLKIMSIGFLVEEAKALIWRGPMVQTALYQMLRDVAWGTVEEPLDILVIDMPPGTGDAQLTLAQKVPVSGAVIVSTPQDLALIDARKAIAMFEKTHVPVLGVIENMSVYVCPSCGHEDHIFGHGGARNEAKTRGVAFLGEIPLTLEIREASDAGKPVAGSTFDEIAAGVIRALA